MFFGVRLRNWFRSSQCSKVRKQVQFALLYSKKFQNKRLFLSLRRKKFHIFVDFRAHSGSPKIESHFCGVIQMSRWNAKHFVGTWNEWRWGHEERPPKELVCVLARSKMNYLPVSTYICIMQIEFLAWILLLLLTTKPFITLHAFSNNFSENS